MKPRTCGHVGSFPRQRVSVKGNLDQSPPTLTVQEGKSCLLHCNYSRGSFDRIFWYRQEVGKSLKLMFALFSNGAVKKEERLTATFSTDTSHSTLSIKGSQPEDSGTYLCAASTQYSPATCRLCTNHTWRVPTVLLDTLTVKITSQLCDLFLQSKICNETPMSFVNTPLLLIFSYKKGRRSSSDTAMMSGAIRSNELPYLVVIGL
uniref:Ig-like domain-containing protein n=1 Tax=Monodelphis domestica TaxID=13616 RepID=A0A5F8G2R5_MONDO